MELQNCTMTQSCWRHILVTGGSSGGIYTSWFIWCLLNPQCLSPPHLKEMRTSEREEWCRWAMALREEGRWQMAAHIGMSNRNDGGRYVQPLGWIPKREDERGKVGVIFDRMKPVWTNIMGKHLTEETVPGSLGDHPQSILNRGGDAGLQLQYCEHH